MHSFPSALNFSTSHPARSHEDTVQKLIKSTEDIIDDDFERLKISDSPYHDPSWSPTQRNSAANFTASLERKPFAPINHQLPLSQSTPQPAFSQTRVYSQGPQPILHSKERMYTKVPENTLDGNPVEAQIRRLIAETMKQQGGALPHPTLKLSIVGPYDSNIEEKDIVHLFSRFGRIIQVSMLNPRTAFIVFDDILNALAAVKALDKCYLKDLNVNLNVSFAQNNEEKTMPAYYEERATSAPSKMYTQQLSSGSNKENHYVPNGTKPSVFTFAQEHMFQPNMVTKHTCKYEVQIDNEKEFRVAQKIIGTRGCNMKRIIEICQSQAKNPNFVLKGDFLKLRLRGKNSGFKEGPDQRESDEPLHLCISSRYADTFELACQLVENLLVCVYRDYEHFCKMINRKGKFPIQIKKTQNFGNIPERLTPENISNKINEPKETIYPGNNGYNNDKAAHFYGNDASFRQNIPNSSFDPAIFYKQFGPGGIANCFEGTGHQQNSNNGKENVPVYPTHN